MPSFIMIGCENTDKQTHKQTHTQTHKQTDRHGHYNTSPSPYGGEVIINNTTQNDSLNETDNFIEVYNNSVIERIQCFGTSFFGRMITSQAR